MADAAPQPLLYAGRWAIRRLRLGAHQRLTRWRCPWWGDTRADAEVQAKNATTRPGR